MFVNCLKVRYLSSIYEDILNSSYFSANSQDLQNPVLDESLEIVGIYTPHQENPPVEISNPLIEVSPVEVHVQQPDHASFNSTIDLMGEEENKRKKKIFLSL